MGQDQLDHSKAAILLDVRKVQWPINTLRHLEYLLDSQQIDIEASTIAMY